jgi:hypothetical protein
MGEFAGGSYNSVRGQTLDPYNVKRNTGGSSSGSGAAISANFAVLAIGTDTSTSVRGPAAYTGIVGMRATGAHIARGHCAENLNFDSAGPMARTVTVSSQITLMTNRLRTLFCSSRLKKQILPNKGWRRNYCCAFGTSRRSRGTRCPRVARDGCRNSGLRMGSAGRWLVFQCARRRGANGPRILQFAGRL